MQPDDCLSLEACLLRLLWQIDSVIEPFSQVASLLLYVFLDLLEVEFLLHLTQELRVNRGDLALNLPQLAIGAFQLGPGLDEVL